MLRLKVLTTFKTAAFIICLVGLGGCDYITAKGKYDELVQVLNDAGVQNADNPSALEQELAPFTKVMSSEHVDLAQENSKLRAELNRREEIVKSMF